MKLSANDLGYRSGGTELVSSVSLQIDSGRVVALVGPNGAGKSTLVRLLSGETKPTSGHVELNGQLLKDYDTRDLALMRSVVGSSTQMSFDFLVHEVLEMGWLLGTRLFASEFKQALEFLSESCEITHLVDRKFNSLSSGERQRVRFVGALLQLWQSEESENARYLLLDEPTANLDMSHELMVLRQMREACNRNIGVLVVLHDLNLAARYADFVVLLHNGKIEVSGSPENVFSADVLSRVYRTQIMVEYHKQLDRLVIYN